MTATTATGPDDHRQVCAYFLAGISAGVLPFQAAKDWAYGVIAAMDHPPIAIIEVAVANGREACLEALACCDRDEDEAAAGRALMADIADRLRSGGIGPEDALALADRVAEVTRMPLDVTLDLHALRAELALARDGLYSTPDRVREDILASLALNAMPAAPTAAAGGG